MAELVRIGAPAAAGLLLAACAGGLSEDRSVTRISSDPSAARCTLQGKEFSQIIHTPAHVVLPKEAAPVTLSCSSANYRTFVTALEPRFNGDVLGNVLLGSMLGLVVDFVNGHNLKYPRHVHLHMEPTVFASVEARERWFSLYRTHVVEKWSNVVGGISNTCGSQDVQSMNCQAELRAAEQARAKELGLLDQRRREAPVGQVGTGEIPATAE